jgi:hypothetical protein
VIDVLYNPTVGANLMFMSFASTYLGDEPLAPTNKSFRIAPRNNLKGIGLLHNVTIHHDKVKMALNFHIFDTKDFDIMIGHPLEKLITEPPKTGELDVKLGRDTFTIPITRAKNSVVDTLPYHELPKGVMSVLDVKLFIKEEDELGESIDLRQEKAPTRPPVELKSLLAGLRYAFLNDGKEAPVIISDKLTDEETSKLIVI